MKHLRVDRLYIFWLLTALVVSLWVLHLAQQIGQPFEGVLVEGFFFEPYRRVEGGTPQWWSASRQNLLQSGDRLWSINGVPYKSSELVSTIQDAETTFAITLERQEHYLEVEIPVWKFTFWHFVDVKLPYTLMAFCLLLIGWEVLRAQPQNPLNRRIVLLCGLFSITFGTWPASLYYDQDIFSQVAIRLTGPLFFPIEVLLLVDIIYRQITPRDRFSDTLYGLSLLGTLIGATALGGTLLSTQGSDQEQFWGYLGVYIALAMIIPTPILIVGRLIWFVVLQRHSSQDFRERQLAKALLLGFGVALPLPIGVLAGDLYGVGYYLKSIDTRYLWLFPVMMLAGAILRYQTFQVSSPGMIIVPILALSGIASSFANSTYQAFLPINLDQDMPSPLLPMFLVMVIISSVWATKNLWREWFGRIFYREYNAFAHISHFSDRLILHAHTTDPAQAVTDALCEQCGLSSAVLWLAHPRKANHYQLTSMSPPPVRLDKLTVEIESSSSWQPIRLDAQDPLPTWAKNMGSVNTSIVLIPLIFEQQLLGWLGAGARVDGEVLLQQDLQTLTVIGRQITLFIYAMYRRIEIENLNHLLHDTTQQFFYQLGYELPLLEASIQSGDSSFGTRIKRLKWEVLDNAQIMRDILAGKLTRNFDDLETLLQSFHRDYVPTLWTINLTQRLDPALEHEVYFWLKECLNNVWKHAQASLTTVHIRQDDKWLTLSVDDNGVGISTTNEANLHRSGGLDRIRTRVEHLGGEFTATSHQGTQILLVLPTHTLLDTSSIYIPKFH